MGRCDYLKKILHIPNVKMAFYVDPSYTLENVVLIATASAVAEDKNWIKKWKLKPKEISCSQEFSYLVMGRSDFVKTILHIPNVKMAFYVDPSCTLENVVLMNYVRYGKIQGQSQLVFRALK